MDKQNQMKNKLLQLLALLLLACAGAPDEPVELGSVQEAIYLPQAYGIDANQNRCWAPNPGDLWGGSPHMCQMPNKLTMTFAIPNPTAPAGSTSRQSCVRNDVITSIGVAAKEVRDQLNARGWNITVKMWGIDAIPNDAIQVFCDNTGSLDNPGTTSIQQICGTFGLTCQNVAQGSLRQFNTNSVVGPKIHESKAYSNGTLATKTVSQQKKFWTNVAMHELYHVCGLGHDTCAVSPLMGLGECINNAYNQVLAPTAFEFSMLDCYNNGSSVQPLCP